MQHAARIFILRVANHGEFLNGTEIEVQRDQHLPHGRRRLRHQALHQFQCLLRLFAQLLPSCKLGQPQ